MLYSDVGFRAIYKKFCCFELQGALKEIAEKHLPGYKKANCLLAYGYIDRSKGLSIEILACGMRFENDKCQFFNPNTQVRTYARIAAVQNIQFIALSNDEELAELYKEKLSVLSEYQTSNSIEQTRLMTFLDSNRDQYNVDDVLVHLIKQGNQVEACWVRIESLKEHTFNASLLNEPYQNLGIHRGDLLEFRVEKNSEKNFICCCYLDNM